MTCMVMSMSDRMSVTEAQTYLGAWSTGDSVDMWKVRAARTIVKADKMLSRLEREYENVAASNPRPGRDEYTAGYLAGIDTAYTWLHKAMEGTHE